MKTKTEEHRNHRQPVGSRVPGIKAAVSLATLLAAFAAAFPGLAAEVDTVAPRESLSRTPAAERPARAAELVRTAKPRERGKLTVQVVQAAASLNPASLSSVVAAISRSAPDMAASAAAAAAEAQPKQAVTIARAAAAAAPEKAANIVTAVCRAVPNQYKAVALAIAEVVPGASKEILLAVAAAVPGLQPGIEAALASANVPSVSTVLESVKPLPVAATAAASVASGVGMSQPAGTLPPSAVAPPQADPPTPGPGPRGHRNYAAP